MTVPPAAQTWDAVRHARNAGFVAEAGSAVLALYRPR